MKQNVVSIFLSLFSLMILLSVSNPRNPDVGTANALALFNKNRLLFTASLEKLDTALKAIDRDSSHIWHARECLRECRLRYKGIAFFTSYFFPSETMMYNAAPVYEVEEPELELVEPMGLQQIEALLFTDDVAAQKADLLAQMDALYSSVKDLGSLLYQFTASDPQVLESVRIELVRMMALYISGYDAPLLKSGIRETLEASKAIQAVLKPYLEHAKHRPAPLEHSLQASIRYLSAHQAFDSFDRMEYLRTYALPLQEQLGAFIKQEGYLLNSSAYLNNDEPNLFSPDFINNWDSIPEANRAALAALGKKLFYDKGLSGNLQVSCATCHQPGKYFTDGRVRSPSLVPDSVLQRNTPTLLYSGKQHLQFWDGRAASLQDQIKTVLFNPLEMDAKKALLMKNIRFNPHYRSLFDDLFPDEQPDDSCTHEIAQAIAAYVAGLNPMNAPFDRYIRGDNKMMTTEQVKGFNLFMGKAQCGTCHFIPYFNSLLPPLYDVSELEVLGTTKNDQFTKPENDADPGRYGLYQIKYYKQAFKTPTVRNTAETGPYMHNGMFSTLENVVDFYNKGGGQGLGLDVPEQTLSSSELHLSETEVHQIVQFIHSLTDSY